MFASISAQSPPLAHFPASQRVTYLYYLGRYLLSNNLFYPAMIALQSAYDQCHRQAISQRHLILTYLISCNIVMGRFPSQELLQRPEARGLAERFGPLCRLIVRGDYIAFRRHLSHSSPGAEWFSRKGILLLLRNRCEILVWRSFNRRVFIEGGFHGDPQAQAQRGPPPFLYLQKLAVATRWLQSQHGPSSSNGIVGVDASQNFGPQTISEPTDPDYTGLADSDDVTVSNADHDILQKYGDYLAPDEFFDEGGHSHGNVPGHLVDGNPEAAYEGLELDPYDNYAEDNDVESDQPSLLVREIESILASLLTQGLMRGYLTHRNPRFAIPGARLRGALPTGFPNVWQTISTREQEDSSVPGWVKPPPPATFGAAATAGGGRVVNLSGARPVGVQ